LMHASMFGSSPAVIYFEPTTLAVLRRIYALRAAGVPAFFTMDAGPHVKVLVEPQHESAVRAALAEVNGVETLFACGLGEGPRVVRLGSS
jgi:diphosphomevalonate decarboxylase